jgi:hypothetical protein
MNRLRYLIRKDKYESNYVMDMIGDNIYQVLIFKSKKIRYEIHINGQLMYLEYCYNVGIAKRKARKTLESLGVRFRKEIRFNKKDSKRKQLYKRSKV